MLLIKIDKSMDRMLEAIDNCDVSLLLEANSEFVKGYEELKKSVGSFIELLEPIEPMKDFSKEVKKLLESLNSLTMEDVSDEYSFTAAYQAKEGGKSKEAETLRTMSAAATNISMYINGLKDAVIAVATWLESTPELFSVGKNGIVLLPEFAKKNQGDELTLADFSRTSGEEILQSIAQDIKEDKDGIKEHFKEFWNSEDDLDETQASQAWEKFEGKIGDIGSNAQKAFQEAENAIKNVKPDEQVSSSVEKKSTLSSMLGNIFGGSKADTPSATMGELSSVVLGVDARTPQKGLWACNFEQLQKLVSGLLAMAESANAGAAAALVGINKQNEEAQPNEEQSAFIAELKEKLKGLSLEDDQLQAVAAAIDETSAPEVPNLEDLDKDELSKMLEEKNFTGEQVEAIIIALFSNDENESEKQIDTVEFDKKKSRTNNLNDFLKKNLGAKWDRRDVEFAFQVLKDEGLITLREGLRDSKADFKKEFLEKVKAKIEGGNMKLVNKEKSLAKFDDKALELLWKYFKEKGVDLNESTIYFRWGQLAGIING